MADTPISSLLLQQAGLLAQSVPGMAAVYLEPSSDVDYNNAPRPCCAIYCLTETPIIENTVRKAKALFQFEIYLKSDPSFIDPTSHIFVSQASLALDKIHADLNKAILIPYHGSGTGNPMFQYARSIEEKLKQKYPSFDDNSVLINQYEVIYFTVRGNQYQKITNNI